MERFIEPTYFIDDGIDDGNTNQPYWYLSRHTETPNGQIVELSDPEIQDWDLTPMLVWCIENFKGKYKICITDYEDFYIEVYTEEDAIAFKLRWVS
ncbi:hypothetical protein LCGC14_1393380 [marine sediment metagenome]|uniref:Uncharacterized protein n=1 Tax=marine sediment metagenome TaxID=412755 RepID=A0A0F9N0W4_9ZZZZ